MTGTDRVLAVEPDGARLLARLAALAEIGRSETGACCRLALTDDDRRGRDLVVGWMRELGLQVSIDPIGNVFGLRRGRRADLAPVMTGSHIDTVRTGGAYDGNYGVLAGLEVVATLNDAGVSTERPLVVAFFTNEEGARFAPDMLGSLVYVGGLALDEALATRAIDGAVLGEELARIGYAGAAPLGGIRPAAFVELHVEQGPVLDLEGLTIGAVENLQGISWQQVDIVGQSNHAGTTPMRMRHDAGYAAAAVAHFVRALTREMGGDQVGTVGKVDLTPNLINVIAARATLTVDLRNTDEALLQQAETRLAAFLDELAATEGVSISTQRLARFEPVRFDAGIAARIAAHAESLGYTHRRMSSGAGHDAQMLARICPTAMIFVPSVGGISHNPAEHTEAADLVAGTRVLLATLLELANEGA
ncbi:Zn-dependent hydrolase [Thauera sp.]|uniref:Zn-dependent hydrolase n=1 Tax=Thauera sp. TaxID=1905334 RepID=UPI002BA8B3CB|nr:Zn-dependent hydrolase [Thauera sp.]HRP24549.1 Zn-dependent hydrolase [Thauera sp.]